MTTTAPPTSPPAPAAGPAGPGLPGSPPAPKPPGPRPIIVRTIGVAAVVGIGFTVWLGLWVTPPDIHQKTLVRLLYLHPPVAWVALYLAFGLAALASLAYLWRRTRSLFWDRLAAAAVEVGVVFNALTLVTGSLWGRPTWGVWWTWTARLTSTALLLILFLGYLALRRVPADPDVRARRCAVAALVAFVDVPIVHFSVDWWQTLHQGASILTPTHSFKVHGSMLWTMLLGFIAMTLVFVWMLMVRYQVEVLKDRVGDEELEVSLAERRAEGDTGPASMAVPPAPASMAVPPAPASMAVPPAPASMAVPPAPASMAVPPAPASMAVPPAPASMAVPPAPAGGGR